MAITLSDDWAWVTFDSTWELLWVLMLAFLAGVCMSFLLTVCYPYPALADRLFIGAVVATGRLIRSLLLVPAGLGLLA